MTQTTNYALPQWGASDRVRRGDFNNAMSKIDTQMKANADAAAAAAAGETGTCKIMWGTYRGAGGNRKEHMNTLTFDGKPLRLVVRNIGHSTTRWFEATYDDGNATTHYDELTKEAYAIWGDNSVSWYSNYNELYQMNDPDRTYYYLVLVGM